MGDIRDAREIAMEKVEKLGVITEEERLKWKYVPEGEKLAAGYLKQNLSLMTELGRYGEGALPYIKEGAAEVFVRNISLPRDESAKKNNRRAMEGLKTLKNDKAAVENVYSKLRRIFSHYTGEGAQQRKQAYEGLKAEFEARLQQAMQQQLGTFAGVKIDVEKQPQFWEEWRKMQFRLDSQYLRLLEEYKREMLSIS